MEVENMIESGSHALELNRVRVLLAEDDDDLRVALTMILRREGYTVTPLSNGSALLDELANFVLGDQARDDFDVIVTDVRMPGFNGLSIVEGLRANGWTHPIVVISAFVDNALIDEVGRIPDVALLAKPFMPEVLCKTLGRFGLHQPRP